MTVLAKDPLDLLLDNNGDIVFQNGDLVWARGLAGIAQVCRSTIQAFTNEWFANLDSGIPYFQKILGFKAAVAVPAAQVVIRAALLTVDGVTAVPTCVAVFDNSTRALTVTWVVSTSLGDTEPDTLVANADGISTP